MDELVSVIIPIYKEPLEWIKLSVKSIIEQIYDNIEIIVIVDNPEREDVVDFIKGSYEGKITLIVNDHNLGLVQTLNRGIEKCHGKYIARMDADDISYPDRIRIQLSYLVENGCDIVGANIVTFNDAEGDMYASHCPHTVSVMKKYILAGGGIPHPTWLVKKEVYQNLKGYRNIELVEDYDFLVRAFISGYKVGCVEDVCLRYRQNLDGISQKNKGRQKYVYRLICEQSRKNRIYSLDELKNRIEKDHAIIEKFTGYYIFTRKLRNDIKAGNYKELINTAKGLKPLYFYIGITDFVGNLRRDLICRY